LGSEESLVPVRIYAHLTWTTFARLPLIDATVATFLERFLAAECQRHGSQMLAIGMVRDHVHLLLELPASFNVPRLVQGLKGGERKSREPRPYRSARVAPLGTGLRSALRRSAAARGGEAVRTESSKPPLGRRGRGGDHPCRPIRAL